MDLWNEYEGRTIAGSFPLEALLRPEGRSAFFATTSAGGPTVIRLIESHFDEDEILARWKAVAALNQPNLLTMPHIGHLVMDDTALVYAVMEPTDADLGQILRERRLTPTETHQVATSLVAALLALRSIGMVHEHLQPMNVLAVGETVKLRSDCVRYAPDGPEGTAAYTRDIQDLCTLLLQCLTLEKTLAKSATYSASLPAPFREIVANGLEGRWGLVEIATSLARSAPLPAAAPSPNTASKPAEPKPPVATNKPEPAAQAQSIPTASAKAAQPAASGASVPASPTTSPVKPAPPASATPPVEPPVAPMFNPSRNRRNPPETTPRDPRLFRATIAAIVVLLVFVFALRVTRRSAPPHPSVPPAPVTQSYSSAANASVPAARTAPPQTEPQPTTSPDNQPWRVVAYTYNKQSQAQAKADALSKQHRGLKIEVFTPTGRAPFLVTLGGPMTRAEAFALKSKLRGNGFPRDLYAQNYGSHTIQHARGRHQR